MALKPTVTRTGRPVSSYSSRKVYGYVAELGDVHSEWLPTREEALEQLEALVAQALTFRPPRVFMVSDGTAFVVYANAGRFAYMTIGADGRHRCTTSTGDSFDECCELAERHARDYAA